jgi:hypothetical protein
MEINTIAEIIAERRPQQFLDRVEAKYLENEDRKILKKLYYRNQLPNELVNLARNCRGALEKKVTRQ